MTKKEILNSTITIKELINFAKRYDDNGNAKYNESMYEGYSVISDIIVQKFGYKSHSLIDSLLPYAKEKD